MSGSRVPALTAISGANTANDDDLIIFDTSTDTTKRISRSQLAAGMVGDLPYTPAGGISATTIPTAIAELTAEKPHILTNIAALRAFNATGSLPTQILLEQSYVAGDGGGVFRYDSTDTTTADNGGTVIVDAAGRRWKRQALGPTFAKWFGLAGDGVTSDVTKIADAISNGFATGSPSLQFAPNEFAIGSGISISDATIAYKTQNGLTLEGNTARPFVRLANAGSPLENIGTRWKWTGSLGGTMLQINGPTNSINIRNLAFNGANGANNAAIGLKTVSNNRAEFVGLTFDAFSSVALDIDVVNANVIPGSTGENDQTVNCYVRDLQINVPANSIGIRLDGFVGSATSGEENGGDPVRWTFDNTYMIVNRTGGIGIDIGFADQNTFTNGLRFTAAGASDGTAAAIRMRRQLTVPSGYNFPQNIKVIGDADYGQLLPPLIVDESSGGYEGGHDLGDATMFDQQYPLAWPARKYARMRTTSAGVFPAGGWVQRQGPELGRYFHNKFLNSRFASNTRGTSASGIATGTYTSDQWKLIFDGTPTVNWQLVTIAPGFSQNDGEPLYALELAVTAGTGGSYFYLAQPIWEQDVGVNLYNGAYVTGSMGIRQTAGTAITFGGLRVEQNFGTGGSPSATVTTEQATPVAPANAVLTSSYKWLDFVADLPSTNGKTLGSNNNHHLLVIWKFPVNATFTVQILLPQFEAGIGASVFDARPVLWDQLECAKFIRKVAQGSSGQFWSATNAVINVPLIPAMRIGPTPTISGNVTLSTPGDSSYTVTTVSDIGTATPDGIRLNYGGTSGATTFRPTAVSAGLTYLSAEF